MTRKNLAKYVAVFCTLLPINLTMYSTLERIANEGSDAFYYGEIGTTSTPITHPLY